MTQVYLGNKLVGNLNCKISKGQRIVSLREVNGFSEWEDEAAINPHAVKSHIAEITDLEIKWRRATLALSGLDQESDQKEIAQRFRERHFVPEDAELISSYSAMTGEMNHDFRWAAVIIEETDVATYERIFDNLDFEPL